MLKPPEFSKLKELVFEEFSIVSEDRKMALKARAFLALFVLVFLSLTDASTDCKNTMMDIILEKCHEPSSRIKRQEVISSPHDGIFREPFYFSQRSNNNSYELQKGLSQNLKHPFLHSPPRLPEETSIDSVFGLSETEMEEMINEIKERLPRSTWTKEILIHAVAKCCQNYDHCRKDPPCP